MILVDRRSIRAFDYLLMAIFGLLLVMGVVLVASAGANRVPDLYRRQALWAAGAMVLAWLVSLFDYRKLADRAYLIWGLCCLALLCLLFFGEARAGATSWFSVGSFGLQPSEFTKVVLVLVLARYFVERDPQPFGLGGLVMPALLVGIPFVLTAMQPDMGTASTFLPILAGVAWVAGIRWRLAAKITGAAAVAAPLGYLAVKYHGLYLHEYQRARILSFGNPGADPLGAGYQVMQAKIAVGSGGLLGKGLFSGSQSQLQFLPAQHTDLIFAVLGEELGFLGVATALGLYLFVLLRVLQTARLSRDRVGAFIASGVAALLVYHLFVNVGMVIGLVPVTGIPLPMLSYGGSSALATGLALGLVLSIRTRRFVN